MIVSDKCVLPLTCIRFYMLKAQTIVQSGVAPNVAHPMVNLFCVVKMDVYLIERRMMQTHTHTHAHAVVSWQIPARDREEDSETRKSKHKREEQHSHTAHT